MASLVPIPWQRHLYLTPHTLGYLTRASQRMGRNLYLYDKYWTTISPAWRSFEQQKAAWDRFLAGGPTASNPYTGSRNHMRGAAFDLREYTTAVQNACRAVGLIRDAEEKWHWNDPNAASMPIILTNTTTSGGTTVPLFKDNEMYLLYNTTTKQRAIFAPPGPVKIITTEESAVYGMIIRNFRGLNSNVEQSVITDNLTAAQWNLLVKDFGIEE